MRRNYLPWKRPEGHYPDRDGLFIAVVPTRRWTANRYATIGGRSAVRRRPAPREHIRRRARRAVRIR